MSSQDGSSSSGTPTKMSGYLMKKSTAGDWQKRYFETNGCFLTYYKSQKMSKLLAALSLPQVGDIRLASGQDGDPCTFQLDLKDRQYILKGGDPREAQQWVDVLICLRDGGGVPAAIKKADSAASTPVKENPSSIYSSPKPPAEKVRGEASGEFVKPGDEPGMDQCAAGCTIV